MYNNFALRNKDVYFIVSTGRTGTKFFETFLRNASDNVYCVHEPQPDLFDISIKKVRYHVPPRNIVDQIIKARRKELKRFIDSGKKVYVESNPFVVFLLPEIMATFPNVKFVFIYREIDSYVKSAMNKSPLSDGRNNFYGKTDGRKRICAKDFPEDYRFSDWEQMSRAQKITWYWGKCNTELLSFSRENSSRVLEISFEKFFHSKHEDRFKNIIILLNYLKINVEKDKLEELCESLGIKVNSNVGFKDNNANKVEFGDKYIESISKEIRNKINNNGN